MLKTNLAFFKLEFNQAIQYRASALVGVLTQIAWGLMYIFLYSSFIDKSLYLRHSFIQSDQQTWRLSKWAPTYGYNKVF